MKFPINFTKMSGTGNDFILIDNRSGVVGEDEMAPLAVQVCRRRQSVGADGLILIHDDPELDFSWRFFNSDGSEAEMCGNGARCAARFAFTENISGPLMIFRTTAGPIEAEMRDSRVRIQLTPLQGMERTFSLRLRGEDEIEAGFINTGVPHTVILVDEADLDDTPVPDLGREIRYHPRFAPAGTNVNFVAISDTRTIRIRTYERGVEGETLACGTGAVAAAVICTARKLVTPPVEVRTCGGESLTIHIDPVDPVRGRTCLEGAAHIIYRGQLTGETVPGGKNV